MGQLTTGEEKRGKGDKTKRTVAKKTQVKTAERRTKTTKTKLQNLANEEYEEDDMGKGLWLLKISKKSKLKKSTR